MSNSRGGLSSTGKAMLEGSDSEAKRIGRSESDLVALALVVARKDSASFDSAFGEGSADVLRELAFDLPAIGDRDSVIEILGRADDKNTAPANALREHSPELVNALTNGLAQPSALSSESSPKNEDQKRVEKPHSPGHSEPTDNDVDESETNLMAMDPSALGDGLRNRIMGQDDAIEAVVRRLALTRAELDLRPHRPDGVFVFVGPTGVGKTEFAKALAAEVMGDEKKIIRLDMSEYSGDWAVSRITGPMPGYAGSDKPAGWLTTKVIANPNSVVLLDEIEKASPTVWNVFLQAFDDGRMTDSRGKVADFSKTIFVMTSNLGAEVFTKNRVGFHFDTEDPETQHKREESGLSEGLRRALPIELFNRIDSVITFRALDSPDIKAIANGEINRVVKRLAARGMNLTVSEKARDHIARSGYDRQLGARHLHRNIESLLLEPLAIKGANAGDFRVDLVDDQIEISGAGP